MSNEKKIIDKIIADAEVEKKKILDEAKKQADAVIIKAEDVAEKEMNIAREEALTEAEKAAAKVISGAAMEAKKAILQTKQQCLEAALSNAKQKLLSLPKKEYEKVILGMLEKAEKGDILLSEKDRDSLRAALAAKGFEISEETRDITGGFIVKKGEIEYNYSFEAIMTVEKEQLEQIAAEILFR